MKGQVKLRGILDFNSKWLLYSNFSKLLVLTVRHFETAVESKRNKIIRAMQLETCNWTYNRSFSISSNHTQSSCNVRLWSCLKIANIKQIKSETKYPNQFRGWFVSTHSCQKWCCYKNYWPTLVTMGHHLQLLTDSYKCRAAVVNSIQFQALHLLAKF